MKDVLVLWKPDDGWNLKMTLRSLCANASNVGRVIIVSTTLPKWIDRSKCVFVEEPPEIHKYKHKHQRMFAAIVHGAREAGIDGRFIYSSDDHFMIKKFDLDNFPRFCRVGNDGKFLKLPFKIHSDANKMYWKSLVDTRRCLMRNFMPTLWMSGHYDMVLDTSWFDKAIKMAGGIDNEENLEGLQLIMASGLIDDPPVLSPIVDRKIKSDSGMPDDAVNLMKFKFLSSRNTEDSMRLKGFIEKLFPTKCDLEM